MDPWLQYAVGITCVAVIFFLWEIRCILIDMKEDDRIRTKHLHYNTTLLHDFHRMKFPEKHDYEGEKA